MSCNRRASRALIRDAPTALETTVASRPIIATTTSNSIRVKPYVFPDNMEDFKVKNFFKNICFLPYYIKHGRKENIFKLQNTCGTCCVYSRSKPTGVAS